MTKSIDILNRAPYHAKGDKAKDGASTESQPSRGSDESTLRVMAYMFPRQFGLHNVFTSHVDRTKTGQKFQDYTLREDEINTTFRHVDQEGNSSVRIRLPKRLRGRPKELVQRLQVLHARCSYNQLLDYYCPRPAVGPGQRGAKQPGTGLRLAAGPAALVTGDGTTEDGLQAQSLADGVRRAQGKRGNGGKGESATSLTPLDLGEDSIVDLATPPSQVSAFCQRVLCKIIPNEIWGVGSVQKHNKELVMENVDRFVRLRRFENMSLHDIYQGMKVRQSSTRSLSLSIPLSVVTT